MQILKKLMLPVVAVIIVLTGCHKWDEYKAFIPKGEKIYPGLDTAISYRTGNSRALLTWPASPDQRITKYAVYWNNKADSLVFNATSHNPKDTVKALIEKLDEGFYAFVIHSFDNSGNKSNGVERNNLRVYGLTYQKSLLNRIVKEVKYDAITNEVLINWSSADNGNTATEITYTGLNSNLMKVKLLPEISSIAINDLKKGAKIYYQSYYKPTPSAIDIFSTVKRDSIIVAN
jgi:hypothetical protein